LGLVVFAVFKRVEIHKFRQKIKRSFHPNGFFAQDNFIPALSILLCPEWYEPRSSCRNGGQLTRRAKERW
jgi:hypothetical protein